MKNFIKIEDKKYDLYQQLSIYCNDLGIEFKKNSNVKLIMTLLDFDN